MLKWFLVVLLCFASFSYAEDSGLDLDFTNAPVSQILQTIATLAGENLVLDQSVTGTMSLHVKHMKWPAALNLVLNAQKLSLKKLGHTWFIGSSAAMRDNFKQQADANTALDQSESLETILIPLHYTNGKSLADVILRDKALLSSRGQLSVDERTNTLIVTDTLSHLASIKTVVAKLDVPVQQVHIEARIVVVDKTALNAFGVTLDNSATSAMNLLGSVNKASVNLGLLNSAGTIGFGLGKLAGHELDLQLQALETSGDGKVISAPELTVSDHQTANVEEGSQVPFQTSTSSGATQIEFINAVLGLTVTPSITAEGKIDLHLKITKNSVSNQVGPAGDVPLINTSEVSTHVMLNNGQTMVLGGIYSEEHEHSKRQVPVLGGIPGIGWLFRNTQDSDKYTDLLIFVTPSIVESPASS